MQAKSIIVPCLAALGLAACVQQGVGPAGSRNPVFAVDMAGKAANCTAPDVLVSPDRETATTIVTGGGGWCGLAVTRGGSALTAGLLTQAPRSGRVFIHTVGDETRVDYTPFGAPVADAFTVKFIPGDDVMRVTVTSAAVRK